MDFQLASEVNTGDYHLRASLGEVRSEKTVSVRPYVLPKFKAELKAETAEDYADDAVSFAIAAVQEAEYAVLDAVLARSDADTLAGTS